MDYLTLENRGTPEQFLDMFSQKINKTKLLPNCISLTDDCATELTYNTHIWGELLQLAYTSGYTRGKKNKPYDLRESRKKMGVPNGAIGKYYFDEDGVYKHTIHFCIKECTKYPYYKDERGRFVFFYKLREDNLNSICACFTKDYSLYSDYWISKDCVVML